MEGENFFPKNVTEFDTAIQLRWAASPNTPISKELLTSSITFPIVHNNYGSIVSLIARLGPVFYLKCKTNEEREKIRSIVLSDEDVKIFYKDIRDVEGLGVDLEIEQDKRDIFGLGSSDVGPLGWDQLENQSREGNNYYIPNEEDIPSNFT
ncbi:hypothetical protein BDZ91DRAFT_804687 [Kalaharituber pfeilii]|nr:hypothetical protein BDZ91DRAFT_804687 [Kalaharituber pfeilii]